MFFDSHGQLGHGNLVSEEEPQAVEALWGVPVKSVAAGSWHSASISGMIESHILLHNLMIANCS